MPSLLFYLDLIKLGYTFYQRQYSDENLKQKKTDMFMDIKKLFNIIYVTSFSCYGKKFMKKKPVKFNIISIENF